MNFLISLAITLVAVPIFSKIAAQMGIVDRPDGVLKTHAKVTPYLGGLGMFLGMIPTLWMDSYSLILVSIAVSLGLMDDIFSLSPKIRLIVEFSLAFGIVERFLGFQNVLYSLTFVVGIVALVNAVNMIDGMDGMAGGSVAVSALFLLLAAENSLAKDLSTTLIAVCLGFLVYNFPPAKVFMGDAGSYLLGTVLSLILASSMRYGFSVQSLKFLFPVWIYFLDIGTSVVRRMKHGRSPFGGDRDHFYDKIFKRVKSKVLTVLMSYAVVGVSSSFILLPSFTLALVLETAFSVFLILRLNMLSYDS